MDKAIQIAVILSAYDRMSEQVARAVSKTNQKIAALNDKRSAAFSTGLAMTATATAGLAALSPIITAFSDLEDASVTLRTQMMDASGNVSTLFDKVNAQAVDMGNKLPGTTADFQSLYKAILENGVSAQSILNGTGKAAAYLAVDAKMGYTEAGISAAKLREATGVADDQMESFIDTISRTKNVGVSVSEMIYSFARSAGALKNVKLQGLEASKGVASIYAMLIRSGMSGETVGTGFTSILTSFYDAKKMEKFKAATSQYGIQLDFVDRKSGKFLGINNMMVQLDKLRGLNTQQRMNVVQALLGPGQDAGMFSILIDKGLSGFKSMQQQMANQATLNQKVEAQLKTLKNSWEAATGTFTNALAAIGAAIGPDLKRITDLLGKIAERLQAFATAHPAIAKSIVLSIALVSAFIGIMGAINLIKSAWLAFQIILNANPWMAAITAIILVVTLIYSNWGAIKAWFIRLWESIKAIFVRFWNWAKYLFLNFTPYGLIIKHWSSIVGFFTRIWNAVKGVFLAHVNFVVGLGSRFYDAGKNIVLSLWAGIKALANKPVDAIREITKRMRDFLPFSPAKEGALRDLHRVKIVETIASAIKPGPLVNAMKGVAGLVQDGFVRPGALLSSGKGNIVVNYSPNIYGVAGADILKELKSHDRELMQLIGEAQRKRQRTMF